VHHLWAPWRMTYVTGSKPDGCVFCSKVDDTRDADNYVLYRGQHNFVILNVYPYNSGHLMVVPYKHVACMTELDEESLQEMFLMAQVCVGVMKQHLHAEGVNLGMNIGQAAGAGIEQHLHLHLVPRWSGDTNYMTTVAGTRVVPQDLMATYKDMLPVLTKALEETLPGERTGC